MLTRRDIICGGMAAAGVPLIGSATPIRSMQGAFGNAVIGEPEPTWDNPYVTDGLVAQWDGIESYKGATWENLVRNSPIGDFVIPLEDGIVDIVDNGIKLTYATAPYGLRASHRIIGWQSMTVEVVTGGMTPQASDNSNISFGFNLLSSVYSRCYWRAQTLLSDKSTYKNVRASLTGTKTFGAVWDSQESNLIGTAFANGIVGNSVTFASQEISPNLNYDFYLMSYFSGTYSNQGPISGTLYGCRVYNKALSSDEIAYNYEVDKERFGLS